MVEHSVQLDNIFLSLADPTRRDILKRVSNQELSVSDIAERYQLTFAAISKHLKVLEKAKLIIKRSHGREHLVKVRPAGLKSAAHCLKAYEKLWNDRFDALDEYLKHH